MRVKEGRELKMMKAREYGNGNMSVVSEVYHNGRWMSNKDYLETIKKKEARSAEDFGPTGGFVV